MGAVLGEVDRRLTAGQSAVGRVWPTGFQPLDAYLGGGVRAGELTLLGGPQGLGKTMLALQALRNVVAGGDRGVYFSFEHPPTLLLERLLALEAGEAYGPEAVPLRRIRDALESADGRTGSLAHRLADEPGGLEALAAVGAWGDRLLVHRSAGSRTTVDEIERVAVAAQGAGLEAPLLVVDYLQKVASPDPGLSEEDRVTAVVQGLKDLALRLGVPVLAVVAAGNEGIASGRRLRTHHLRGSSALAYEADVILIMNDKFDVVARHHLVYDAQRAARFRDYIVLSVEKNRGGLDRVDLEFRKRFDQGRFEAAGALVDEQLVDERVYVE